LEGTGGGHEKGGVRGRDAGNTQGTFFWGCCLQVGGKSSAGGVLAPFAMPPRKEEKVVPTIALLGVKVGKFL
jgi:hypothetical protein